MTELRAGAIAIMDQCRAEVDDLIEAWKQERANGDLVYTIGGLSAVLMERHGDNFARYAMTLFMAIERLAEGRPELDLPPLEDQP